jgi:hypothetical protein
VKARCSYSPSEVQLQFHSKSIIERSFFGGKRSPFRMSECASGCLVGKLQCY